MVSHRMITFLATADISVIILVVPIYNVAKLQMPLRRKLGICGIFLLGGFVLITGIVRLYYLHRAFHALDHPLSVDVYCKCLGERKVPGRC
jgi:uncharacterized membrane protein